MAIVTGIEANARLTKGALAVVRAIKTAFGPYGRGVMFHRSPAAPEVIHDGYSIAREMCWDHGIEATRRADRQGDPVRSNFPVPSFITVGTPPCPKASGGAIKAVTASQDCPR
jgi:hypothetical protein